MFKIIGADQKEYGPISAEQIRQWIVEGRLNAQTPAQRAAGGEWRPLSGFEEFADLAPGGVAGQAPAAGIPAGQAAPMSTPLITGSPDAAIQAVKAPAIALIVTASLGVAYYLFNAVFTLFSHGPMFNDKMQQDMSPQMRAFFDGMHGPGAAFFSLIFAGINGFVLFGAIKMLKLQSHSLAIAACVVAMIPCSGCCCILGLPFGIWGLIVLNKPEVKSQF